MENSEKYIGVFDSGMGGLTVVREIEKSLPGENIVYFGDTAHVPYGTKTKEEITGYVLEDIRFLRSFDIKSVVIACNTADSVARDAARDSFPDIPVFGIVEPTARLAASVTQNNIIGVIATNAAVNSGSYEREIKKVNRKAQVLSVACPLLVPFAEAGRFRPGDTEVEEALKGYLLPLKEKGIDTLVFGCTHYPLFEDIVKSIVPGVKLVSSSAAAISGLRAGLEEKGLRRFADSGEKKFYVSGNPGEFEKAAGIFMGEGFRVSTK